MSVIEPPVRTTPPKTEMEEIGASFGRKWDLLLIVLLIPAFAAIAHITHMLIVGDWDFWADWKDRQWWPFITPMVSIVIPVAAQYIVWRLLGLCGGATAAAVMLVLAQWVSRFFTFHQWVYYPLAFVAPATLIPGAVVLDLVWLLTRSHVLTSVIGGMSFGILFQPANLVLFAGMWAPTTFQGQLMTVADSMGFQYLRTQAPSYLRIVEEGALRAFIEQINIVVGMTAGVACIAFYWGGYALGRFVAFAPGKIFIKTRSPILAYLHPGEEKSPPPAVPASVGAAGDEPAGKADPADSAAPAAKDGGAGSGSGKADA